MTRFIIMKSIHIGVYKLTMKRKNIQDKVGDIMGGQVLDLPEFRIFDEGKAEGELTGRAAERTEGIRIFIADKIEDGIPDDRIVEKLVKSYSLTETDARECIQRYKDSIKKI
ncbi:MAG: hypothetical protein K5894_12985 [Lachnospiraceae bacterium]|nr:hypothetical protein [Lachnospiraceae bacterium]